MDYFHVKIINQEDKEEQINNLSEKDLFTKIIHPYEQGKGIFVNGTNINSLKIGRIHIRKTDESYSTISNRLFEEERMARNRSTKQGIFNLTSYNNIEKAFWQGEDVLDNYISGPPGYKIDTEKKSSKEDISETKGNKVFIVHGHSEEMKQSVARFVESIDLQPIILHEQPDKERTIIEKFSDYSNVDYAIVLLSGDDLAYTKGDNANNARYRARQNVILELSYFPGKLVRNKVAAVYEKEHDIEIPSDFSGVLYIEYSGNESWKLRLAKELKASNFNIDLNKLI